MLKGYDIVCLSVMDWDWPFQTSRHHLMREFARCGNRVLFVDPPLMYLSDYRGCARDGRLRAKLQRWLHRPRLVEPNLFVYTPPPTVPFNRITRRWLFHGLLALNQKWFNFWVHRMAQALGFRCPILWTSFNVYFGVGTVGHLGERLAVYHCTDEISGFPGYSPWVGALEAELIARSDLVFTSSAALWEAKRVHNASCYFVPNGANVHLFAQALDKGTDSPGDIATLPRPRVGFIGQVEYRFDSELVASMARARPNWSLVLVGPVQRQHSTLDVLNRLPNVYFLGQREQAALPAYLRAMDVTIIPYKINHLTRSIYPLKLHEYLAAGKPVVATPLPSLSEFTGRGMVWVAGDAKQFVQSVEEAIRGDNPELARQRSKLAESHSWTSRAEEMSLRIEQHLARSKW